MTTSRYDRFVPRRAQDWTVGSTVNVGFLNGLTVVAKDTDNDGWPLSYTLRSAKGVMYRFIPHHGISRLDD